MNISQDMDYHDESSDEEEASDISSSTEDESEYETDFEADESEPSYDPEGIQSDDDDGGCCHWSEEPSFNVQNIIAPDEGLEEYGTPLTLFPNETKPHEIIEVIMDEEFILNAIDATNEHGSTDPLFLEKIGQIPHDEKGIYFVRGYFAIKWHLRLLRYAQIKWAWSADPLKEQKEIKKIMTLEAFKLMLKHFRVVLEDDNRYHSLQNINQGVECLRKKSLSHWKLGWKMCIDEGRVRSKSKRNPYKFETPTNRYEWDGQSAK